MGDQRQPGSNFGAPSFPAPVFPGTQPPPAVSHVMPPAVPPPNRAGGRVGVLIGCALAVGLAIGAGAMFVGRDSGTAEPAAQSSVAQPAVVADPTTTLSPVDVTFATMNEAARRFYGMLPDQAASAWPLLGSSYQVATGYSEFIDWWATVRSVTVLSVTPRDATSVVVRLKFVMVDQRTETEDRWLSFVARTGGLVILDSERIGAV